MVDVVLTPYVSLKNVLGVLRRSVSHNYIMYVPGSRYTTLWWCIRATQQQHPR